MKTCPECYNEFEDDKLEKCPDDQTPLRVIEKDPMVGSKLDKKYEVVSVLGRGGMGVVYKVHNEVMDKFMAVKMLHSHLVSDTDAVVRFRQEASTIANVRHHHIITLYDFGMSPTRQPYLVMDYLQGTSLKSVLKEEGPVNFERAGHIYDQVVDALTTAHGMDLVHRDLKPENIMLTKSHEGDDWVTLVDFGLSKLKESKKDTDNYHITKVGDVCGSPPYMSPEQCLSSQIVDPRSDIYSLAICVYETLSAKLPFNAKSAIEMLDAHLYATPIPFNQSLPELKVCTELTHVLNKALQKDPDKRQQTIQEFGKELGDAVRRDGLKLRTFKTRLEVSSFTDLLSEAEALHKAEQEKDKVAAVSVAELVEVPENGRNKKKRFKSMNGVDLLPVPEPPPEPTLCPYCDAEIAPGIKFCVKCQHSVQDMAKAKVNKVDVARGKSNEPKGFTARMKVATTSQPALKTVFKGLGVLVLVLLLGSIVYVAQHPTLISSLTGGKQNTLNPAFTNKTASSASTKSGTTQNTSGKSQGRKNRKRRNADS